MNILFEKPTTFPKNFDYRTLYAWNNYDPEVFFDFLVKAGHVQFHPYEIPLKYEFIDSISSLNKSDQEILRTLGEYRMDRHDLSRLLGMYHFLKQHTEPEINKEFIIPYRFNERSYEIEVKFYIQEWKLAIQIYTGFHHLIPLLLLKDLQVAILSYNMLYTVTRTPEFIRAWERFERDHYGNKYDKYFDGFFDIE